VNVALAQREIALAGTALLAIVVAVALAAMAHQDEGSALSSAPAPGTDWYRAIAAPYRFPAAAKRTACGQPAGPKTLGVAHPVLPCGAKITILFQGRQVLTQVVDRGTGVPGREFDVTAPLARKMGLTGIQPIRWRFAQSGG
jgi:rare lipoprotein A (peptidoglycan hydrolase)